MSLGWTASWAATSPATYARDRLHRRLQLSGVVNVCPRHSERQGRALSVNHQVKFAPGLPAVSGVWARRLPPAGGRHTRGVQGRA